MIAARFRQRLPGDMWVSEVSRTFPDATFRLLSGMRRGDTAVELGESLSEEPSAVVEVALAQPSITSYEQLELCGRRSFSKYETTDTRMYSFFGRASVPPEFPIVVEDGWSQFELTGTREDFERTLEVLERTGAPYELVSVVESPEDASEPLTDRQREVLGVALREGYFSVPRDCTLAELAAGLDVDKSTASGVIRRGQARLLKQYLVGTGTDPRQ